MKGLLQNSVAVLGRIFIREFGVRRVVNGSLFLLGCFLVLLLTLELLLSPIGRGLTLAVLVAELLLFWRFQTFDLIGQLLLAVGLMRENVSKDQEARRWFVAAALFLRDRTESYLGLFRLAQGSQDFLLLAERIEVREQLQRSLEDYRLSWPGALSRVTCARAPRMSASSFMRAYDSEDCQQAVAAELGLLVARCFRRAGDLPRAQSYLELIVKCAPCNAACLELAEICQASGAPEKCLGALERMSGPDTNGLYFFLRASAFHALGKPEQALQCINRAIQLRPCDPDNQLEKGRILETLGRHRAALRQFDKSIRVHPRNPRAFYHRGLLRLKLNEPHKAAQDLERCCFFHNTWTKACLLADAAKRNQSSAAWNLAHAPAALIIQTTRLDLEVGQTANLSVTVLPAPGSKSCHLHVLEPFGFGLEASPLKVELDPAIQSELTVQVKAKRPDDVNLNQAWVLNLVLITDTVWANQLVEFHVKDIAAGRIFFVLTNDHEPQLHRDRLTRGSCVVRPEETEFDLAAKTRMAEALAEKYSFKWTHLLDAGTAVGVPKWAANLTSIWKAAWSNIETCYRQGAQRGHDHQVHLHLSGVPESYFFCYAGTDSGDLVFDLKKKNKHFPGWQINSWANVVPRYGRHSDPNSRLGSLIAAAETVRTVLGRGSRNPVFFRAGQWDLGNRTAEREKSIMALRESLFLADTSVTEGYDCNKRPFRFGTCPSRATYFTHRNNPEQPAQSLQDAGILEVVPIVLQQGNHPMGPREDSAAVIAAYKSFLLNGTIKSGRHVILEIEHLASLSGPSGAAPALNADWAAMEHHFATVSRNCPALESTSASQAIFSWLDYYSPELVVQFEPPVAQSNPSSELSTAYHYPLRFLGQGILCDNERLYDINLPLPAPCGSVVSVARILRDGNVVHETFRPGRWLALQLRLSNQNKNQFALEMQVADRCPSSAGSVWRRVGDVNGSALLVQGEQVFGFDSSSQF